MTNVLVLKNTDQLRYRTKNANVVYVSRYQAATTPIDHKRKMANSYRMVTLCRSVGDGLMVLIMKFNRGTDLPNATRGANLLPRIIFGIDMRGWCQPPHDERQISSLTPEWAPT